MQVSQLVAAVVIVSLYSLPGLPAITPFLRYQWAQEERTLRFSLASILGLIAIKSVAFAVMRQWLDGTGSPYFIVAFIVVGFGWWLTSVWITSTPNLLTEREKVFVLCLAIPLVFVGALFTAKVALGEFLVEVFRLPPNSVRPTKLDAMMIAAWIGLVVALNRWANRKIRAVVTILFNNLIPANTKDSGDLFWQNMGSSTTDVFDEDA